MNLEEEYKVFENIGFSASNTLNQTEENDYEVTKEQELRILLADWEMENLAEYFLENKMYVDVLKVMKYHHIERLMNKFDFGTQILFEHKLEKWRQDIGRPLVYKQEVSYTTNNNSRGHTTSTFTSIRSRTPSPPMKDNNNSGPPPSASSYSSYVIEEPPPLVMRSEDFPVSLLTILNETAKGAGLIRYYEKFSKFQEEQRVYLINLVAQYFQDKGIPLSLSMSYRLECEIAKIFPTEKLEYYRCGKRGRVYNKYCNLKTLYKSTISKHVVEKKKKIMSDKKYRPELNYEPEAHGETCFISLKFSELNSSQFEQAWKACVNYRLNDLKSLGSLEVIRAKWPFYFTTTGWKLIGVDFTTAYGDKKGLLKSWVKYENKLMEFLCNEHNVKDKCIRNVLDAMKRTNPIVGDSKVASLLWALHGYLVPSVKGVKNKGPDGGKFKLTKYTIRDSQEAFVIVFESMEHLDDFIENSVKKKEPSIYCLGETIMNIKEIYVIFDDVRYKFDSFLQAVDVCFEMYYLFEMEFPKECSLFYCFIENFFFDFPNHQNFARIAILGEYLRSESG